MATGRECLGFFEPDPECLGNPKAKDDADKTPCAEMDFCKKAKEVAKAKGIDPTELLNTNSRERVEELHRELAGGKAEKGAGKPAKPAAGSDKTPPKPTKDAKKKGEVGGKAGKPEKPQEKPQPEKQPEKAGKGAGKAKPEGKAGKPEKPQEKPQPESGKAKPKQPQHRKSAERGEAEMAKSMLGKAKRFLQPKLKDLGIKVQHLGDGKFKIGEKDKNPFRQGCGWWYVTEAYRVGGTPETVAERALKLWKADQ